MSVFFRVRRLALPSIILHFFALSLSLLTFGSYATIRFLPVIDHSYGIRT